MKNSNKHDTSDATLEVGSWSLGRLGSRLRSDRVDRTSHLLVYIKVGMLAPWVFSGSPDVTPPLPF